MPDPLKLTPDAEAVWAEFCRLHHGPSARGYLTQQAFVEAVREITVRLSWHVNPDGSVSPPGRPECKVEPELEDFGVGYQTDRRLSWWWEADAAGHHKCGNEPTFPDAARALMKALEESDVV